MDNKAPFRAEYARKGAFCVLTGFIRTIILFFVTTIVLRLMGKRQLAELKWQSNEKAGNDLALLV